MICKNIVINLNRSRTIQNNNHVFIQQKWSGKYDKEILPKKQQQNRA